MALADLDLLARLLREGGLKGVCVFVLGGEGDGGVLLKCCMLHNIGLASLFCIFA